MVAVPSDNGSGTIDTHHSLPRWDSRVSASEAPSRGGNEMSWCAMGGNSLTKGEAEVLALVDSGLSNREIAATLSIAVGTVKCHLHRVYEKLQVRNRIEVVVKVREPRNMSFFACSSVQG